MDSFCRVKYDREQSDKLINIMERIVKRNRGHTDAIWFSLVTLERKKNKVIILAVSAHRNSTYNIKFHRT